VRKPRPVLIDWIDSVGLSPGWEHTDSLEPLRPMRCRTAGFLLQRTKKYTTVTTTLGEGQVLGRLTIPNTAIRRIRKLK